MLKLLQDLLVWLSTFAYPAKILISVALILIAGAFLIMMWTSHGQTGSSTVSPQSLATIPSPAPKPMWPQVKTIQGLKRLLDRTSKTNREILLVIVDSGRDGVYVSAGPNSLQQKFSLSRNDILYRGTHLQSLQLIETIPLDDTNYRLDEDVLTVLGQNGSEVLKTLLK